MSIPNGDIAINNSTGTTLNLYNFNYGLPQLESKKISVPNSQTQNLSMSQNIKMMRVYFSTESLNKSVGNEMRASAPDPFNPSFDGDKPYSFIEYYYEKTNSRYTIDISFIDTFSYPITIEFDNEDNTGKVWGIKDMNKVVSQLGSQSEAFWSDLVWRNTDNSILRIVGPNKGMQAPDSAPQSIINFKKSFPPTGTTLKPSNWKAWQRCATEPATTGYVKALRAASLGQQVFKTGSSGVNQYGFFTYPMDNSQGQFTYVPEDIHCTITIYPPGDASTSSSG